jgi:hypothetical protein
MNAEMVMEVTLKMSRSDRGSMSRSGGAKLHLIFGDQKERRLDFQISFSFITFMLYIKKDGSSKDKLVFEVLSSNI